MQRPSIECKTTLISLTLETSICEPCASLRNEDWENEGFPAPAIDIGITVASDPLSKTISQPSETAQTLNCRLHESPKQSKISFPKGLSRDLVWFGRFAFKGLK